MKTTRRFILVLVAISVPIAGGAAAAGPIEFFKRLSKSVTHPRRTEPARRTTRKSSVKPNTQTRDENGAAKESPSPATTDVPVQLAAPVSPSPVAARAAASVPPAQRSRADLPYGVPVPNSPGFVTSPYSPHGGYVDVRGYASGIEVKDPYTGKIFLTP